MSNHWSRKSFNLRNVSKYIKLPSLDIKWVQFIITFADLFLVQVVLTCGRNGTVVVGGHIWSIIATFCVPFVISKDAVVIVAHGHAGWIFICFIPLTGTKLLPAAVWEYLHCTDRWVLLCFKTQGKFFKYSKKTIDKWG